MWKHVIEIFIIFFIFAFVIQIFNAIFVFKNWILFVIRTKI